VALILLSWLYILFTSLTIGIGFSKLFRVTTINIVLTSILGLFSITMFASFWAIFGAINIAFHSVLLFHSLLIGIKYKELLITLFRKTKEQFYSFPFSLKSLLLVSGVLILAQSAALPFIIDNETYYIQTIKWLNEYGFVPGLANLHLFFGQTSGWHITQSVYSFSFLYESFNDLNGYCLLLGNFWAFHKLHSYFVTKNKLDLVFGLLPLTYAFMFQFISAPSPDFPLYVFGFILFSLYMESSIDKIKEDFTLITTLALFLVYIKITAVVLLLLPTLLYFRNYTILKKEHLKLTLLASIVFVVLLIKNTILSGYPLFPLTLFQVSGLDYIVPKEIMDFFFSKSMMHSFYIPFGAFDNLSLFDILKHYFLQNGLDSIIAITTVGLLIISPIVIAKQYSKTKVWDVYVAFLLLIVFLVFSSPQYRFYVYFTLFFGLLLLSVLLTNRKMILVSLGFSFTVVAVLVFVPLSYTGLTKNKSLADNSTFQVDNILIPKPNTKGNQNYSSLSKGNLPYYSPIDYTFFWITGNGDLPCVNTKQLKYFETKFHVIPQLRGTNLSDGFYAKKTNTND
jgi:hypothetical protein